MRTIAISVQNTLLSDAIVMCLKERAELRVQRLLPQQMPDAVGICRTIQARVLLMEVTRIPPFTLPERLAIAAAIQAALPSCRIALLCDERADADLAEQIKTAKQFGKIDAFFYASVSAQYLAAMLDTL